MSTLFSKKTEESVQMLSLLIEMSLAADVITAVSHREIGKTSWYIDEWRGGTVNPETILRVKGNEMQLRGEAVTIVWSDPIAKTKTRDLYLMFIGPCIILIVE